MGKNGKESEGLICPFCNKVNKPGGGHLAHVRSCMKMPSREELARDCQEGATIKRLKRYYSVGGNTIKRWLEIYGLETIGGGRQDRSADRLRIYPGYAPKFDKRQLQCVDSFNRPVCNAYEECQTEVTAGRPCLCEAPDRGQKEALEREGYDLLYERTELWVEKPEIWTE